MAETKSAAVSLFKDIDLEYFAKIADFIRSKEEGDIFVISDLTDDPGKLIHHIKFYIDNWAWIDGFASVVFNNDYTKFRIEHWTDHYKNR